MACCEHLSNRRLTPKSLRALLHAALDCPAPRIAMSRMLGHKEIVLVDYFDSEKHYRRQLLCPGDIHALDRDITARCSRKERFVKIAQRNVVTVLQKFPGAHAQAYELCKRMSRGMYAGERVGGVLHLVDLAQIFHLIYPLDCGIPDATTYCNFAERKARVAANKEHIQIFRSSPSLFMKAQGERGHDEETIYPELTTADIYKLAFLEDAECVVRDLVSRSALRFEDSIVSLCSQNEGALLFKNGSEIGDQKRSIFIENIFDHL